MDLMKKEIEVPASTDEQLTSMRLTELAEFQLVFVGGGIGDAQV